MKNNGINLIYTSTQSVNQEDAFEHLTTQESDCREFLKEEGIIGNIIVLNELQIGNKKPVFYSLIALIKSGNIQTVTIESTDRISRARRVISEFIAVAIENGVTVNFVKKDVENSTLLQVIKNLAEYYAENL